MLLSVTDMCFRGGQINLGVTDVGFFFGEQILYVFLGATDMCFREGARQICVFEGVESTEILIIFFVSLTVGITREDFFVVGWIFRVSMFCPGINSTRIISR